MLLWFGCVGVIVVDCVLCVFGFVVVFVVVFVLFCCSIVGLRLSQ